MARPSHNGGISFGLLYIPVSLYTATQDNDIQFNQLCKDGDQLSRIKYKKVCVSCGKEVTSQDIIRGYEYDAGQFVTISDGEIEKIKTEKDKSIKILHFTELSSIPPVYFDRTYHAIPSAGAEKAFELLRLLMLEENKVAVARTVMGEKENMLALIPTKEGILANILFFADEVRNQPKVISHPEIEEQERMMGKQLIQSMTKEFEPELYHNEFQARLRELVQKKIDGKEIVQAKDGESAKIIDIMEALQKSLAAEQKTSAPKKSRGGRKIKGA